MPVDIW